MTRKAKESKMIPLTRRFFCLGAVMGTSSLLVEIAAVSARMSNQDMLMRAHWQAHTHTHTHTHTRARTHTHYPRTVMLAQAF